MCATQGDSLRNGEVIVGSNGARWRFSRKDRSQGRWGVFYPDRGDSRPVQCQLSFPKRQRSVTRLPVYQRDTPYRLLLERQPLQVEDAEDLFRRGFTPEKRIRMRVKPEARSAIKTSTDRPSRLQLRHPHRRHGYFILTFNWDGQISGGQLQPIGGKYKWLPQCHVEGGELLFRS